MIKFIKHQKGATAVEFAMILLPFLVLLGVLIEILLLIYMSIAIEYLNAQSAKYASSFSYQEGYAKKYREYLESKIKTIGFFLKEGNYHLDIQYCKNLEEFYEDSCTGSNDEAQILIYKLKHSIHPIFLFNWISNTPILQSQLAYYPQRQRGKDETN